MPGQRRIQPLRQLVHRLHRLPHLAGRRDQPQPVGTQHITARGAVEHLGADALLKGGDAAQNGGVIDPHLPRCPRDAARFDHGQHELQIVPVQPVQD